MAVKGLAMPLPSSKPLGNPKMLLMTVKNNQSTKPALTLAAERLAGVLW